MDGNIIVALRAAHAMTAALDIDEVTPATLECVRERRAELNRAIDALTN